jgi:mono/diheme cytochrome c family protein
MTLKIYLFSAGLCFFLLLSCVNSAEKTYNEGAQLYKVHCENCHMEDGKGFEQMIPPLAGADMLENMGVGAACVIQNGLKGKILVNEVEYEIGMDPIKGLSVVEITNIVNYIHNAWGNKRAFIQLNEVESALEGCSQKN